MFPESIRNFTYSTVVNTKLGICKAYGFSRGAAWVVFSTSIILFAPVIFEVERANMEEMQRNQQKQVLYISTLYIDMVATFLIFSYYLVQIVLYQGEFHHHCCLQCNSDN